MLKKIIKFAFFLCFFVSVAFNLLSSHKQIQSLYRKYGKGASSFLGAKFAGLKPFLKNSQRIGYLTDQSLDEKIAAAEFAQAQYVLAPIILDFNNPNLRFVLVNASSLSQSLELIKQHHLKPLKGNQFNILLTQNPDFP